MLLHTTGGPLNSFKRGANEYSALLFWRFDFNLKPFFAMPLLLPQKRNMLQKGSEVTQKCFFYQVTIKIYRHTLWNHFVRSLKSFKRSTKSSRTQPLYSLGKLNSISPTFYEQLFQTKMYLQCIFNKLVY